MIEKNKVLDFDFIFLEYYNALCYFSYKFLPDKKEAEDLVQDAFLQLYHKRAAISDVKAAKAFLYTCIRNAALNMIRHEKVHDKFINSLERLSGPEDSILEDIVKAEVMNAIYHAVESLPEGCKRIFKMGYLDELKNHEIAEKLNVSVNTVKTQKKRALQLLRIKLNDISLIIACIILFTHEVHK